MNGLVQNLKDDYTVLGTFIILLCHLNNLVRHNNHNFLEFIPSPLINCSLFHSFDGYLACMQAKNKTFQV